MRPVPCLEEGGCVEQPVRPVEIGIMPDQHHDDIQRDNAGARAVYARRAIAVTGRPQHRREHRGINENAAQR